MHLDISRDDPVRTRKAYSRIRQCCTFIYLTFKSQMELSNAQRVSAPSTITLPTTADTSHGLNCFGKYVPQTSTYNQNISKLLTHPNIFLCSSFGLLIMPLNILNVLLTIWMSNLFINFVVVSNVESINRITHLLNSVLQELSLGIRVFFLIFWMYFVYFSSSFLEKWCATVDFSEFAMKKNDKSPMSKFQFPLSPKFPVYTQCSLIWFYWILCITGGQMFAYIRFPISSNSLNLGLARDLEKQRWKPLTEILR